MDTYAAQPATDEEKAKALRERGQRWMERIRASEKREKDWMDDAKAAEKAYTNDASKDSKGEGALYDFNILHSNVETIVPAIYNSTPVPDVRSRNIIAKPDLPPPPPQQPGQQPDPRIMQAYQQAQEQAQQAEAQTKAARDFGTMIERAITVQIDDNKLDTEVESCAQDAFLAGRGIVRLRFYADFDDGEKELPAVVAEKLTEDEPRPAPAQDAYVAGGPSNERICFEAVSWRDYRRGPAKRWDERPWEAFRHSMSKESIDDVKDADLYKAQAAEEPEEDKDGGDFTVWEIWDRKERQVEFVRECDGAILKQQPDPLELTNFFPSAKPVQPISLTGKLTPVCPFSIYRKLADELDLCTRRINAIMRGLKVRGAVVGQAEDILKLATAGDNELVALENLEGLAQTGGIEKAILWWPIEQAITVLKELYVQREQTKQAIYELTGISDIVRGASNAQETATAQQIKTQWGSLRIQKMQRLIQRLVRDLFMMSAEIITTKFSPQTLQAMTGIQITPELQQLMSQKVLAFYRVDVESDSTVKADTTRIRSEMGEFMQGTANYFKVMAPLVQSSQEAAGPVARIYSAFAQNYNIGKQAEDALDELIKGAEDAAKQPPKPNPEQEAIQAKAQADQAKAQSDMQAKQIDAQIKMQSAQQDAQIKHEQAQAQLASIHAKARQDAQKHQQEMQKGALEVRKLELELAALQTPEPQPMAEQKAPSESIAFKDLPPEGQAQMAAQAGIHLSPEQMAAHQAEQDAKEAAKVKAKTTNGKGK